MSDASQQLSAERPLTLHKVAATEKKRTERYVGASIFVALLTSVVGLAVRISPSDGAEQPSKKVPAAAAKTPDEADTKSKSPGAAGPTENRAATAASCKAGPGKTAIPDGKKAVELRGVVVDEHDQPIAGIKVERISARDRTETISAQDGSFALKLDSTKGVMHTLVATTESRDRQAIFEQFYYEEKRISNDLRLTLRPAREISASIVDADQRPVAGATLRAITQAFSDVGMAVSDANGTARMLIPRDTALQYMYAVKPHVGLDYFIYRPREAEGAPDNPFALPPDHDQRLVFVLNGTRAVTVRVADHLDKPLAELPVYPWYFEKPKKGGHLNLGGASEFRVLTDNQGRAVFHTIPADNTGRVTFWVRHDDYFTPKRPMFDPAVAINELKVTLLPLIPVKGTVTFADGRPVGGAEITVAGNGYAFDGFSGTTQSAADGSFEIRVNPEHYCMFQARRDRQISAAEARVVRTGDPVEAVQLTLRDAARIYGTVTVGKDDKPVPNQSIQLYLEPNPEHYRLPQADQLANPEGERRAIMPRIIQDVMTGADGQYEFLAGPGKYYLIRIQATEKAPQFVIADEKEFEVNFHSDLPNQIEFQGHIVRETLRKRGIPETKVDFAATEDRASPWNAIGDKTGQFRCQRTPCEMLLYSQSDDGLLAGITKIEPEDATAEISLVPTASARGRLMDAATGLPLAGAEIQYGVRVTHPGGSFGEYFGGSIYTDAAGEFFVTRLIPEWEYKLNVVNERDAEGWARRQSTIGVVKAERTECVDVGDFQVTAPPREPLDALAMRVYKSPGTLVQQFDRALAQAALAQRRLLVVLAANDAPARKQFFKLYFQRTKDSDQSEELIELLGNFTIQTVDPKLLETDPQAQAWAKRLKITRPPANGAMFLVFESDGRLVAQTESAELFTKGLLDVRELTKYLTEQSPPVPNAEKIFAAALADAKRDDKRVILVQTEKFSAPTTLLVRWLEANRDLLSRDYIVVKINPRDENSEKLIAWIRGESGTAPWIGICDPAGKLLSSSDGPDGNVGYPVNAADCKLLERMFQKTARRLKAADLEELMNRLD